MRVTVICRDCGREQVVEVGEPGTIIDGFFNPDCCGRCESTDLSALRDLSTAELAELEEEFAQIEHRSPRRGDAA